MSSHSSRLCIPSRSIRNSCSLVSMVPQDHCTPRCSLACSILITFLSLIFYSELFYQFNHFCPFLKGYFFIPLLSSQRVRLYTPTTTPTPPVLPRVTPVLFNRKCVLLLLGTRGTLFLVYYVLRSILRLSHPESSSYSGSLKIVETTDLGNSPDELFFTQDQYPSLL